jgi:hypothetical protein
MNDDQRAMRAAQARARWTDLVYREMMHWAMIGKKRRPGTGAKISATRKGRPLRPQHAANVAAANRRKAQDPAWRAKVSAAIALKYRDPEYHSKMAALARGNGKLGGRPRKAP